MSHLVKFPLDSGGFVFIEAEASEDEGGIVKAGLGFPDEAVQSFETAMNNLGPIASTIVSKLISISNPPDEASVEFGLTLSAGAGIVITKVETEANFKVSLTWTRGKPG